MTSLHKALSLICIILSLIFNNGQSQFFFRNPLADLLNHGLLPRPPLINEEPNINNNPNLNGKGDLETNYRGAWELVNINAGVSSMHMNLLPNNKMIMFDASAFRISGVKHADGTCVPFFDEDSRTTLQDCWAHAIEYDVFTHKTRTLKIMYDAWCSSGSLGPDGTLVSTGGWNEGIKTVRYMSGCPNCDFKEYHDALADSRWYATQITLQDGGFLVVGGRKTYSYELMPPAAAAGKVNDKPIFLPLLDETTDLEENNLYPFVHLSTDGNVFIFANNRSILLNLQNNQVVREFPQLEGGARNYPASGMSALIPINLNNNNNNNNILQNPKVIPAEVIICGGAKQEAYGLAGKQNFLPALQDCNRIEITNPDAEWIREEMPSRRVMGDMLILPTGDLLLINGAQKGAAAWFFAEEPNLTPLLYKPHKPVNQRFTPLKPTMIPRMYHSTANVLPNGKILVAGSNSNPGYNYKAKYPTELRVETFSPPYLDPVLIKNKPRILPSNNKLAYGQQFQLQFQLAADFKVEKPDIKVTMLAPPFTTHGYSMNQRMLILGGVDVTRTFPGTHGLKVMAPPSNVVAPPGFYLLFVVYRGVPSDGIWVQIK